MADPTASVTGEPHDATSPGSSQLFSLRAAGRRRPAPVSSQLAEPDPVARVVVDVPVPHLDHHFDYAVPAELGATAVPGARVKVRLAGQDLDAFVLERRAASEHPGSLHHLRRVVSPEPILTPATARLARAVADRYAGTLADVLRLAIPPRHMRAEKAVPPALVPEAEPAAEPSAAGIEPGEWAHYPAGPAFVQRLAQGYAARGVWQALPGPHWALALAQLAQLLRSRGRGTIIVVPDSRDADTVEPVLAAALGEDGYVRLEAGLGPQARYEAYLKVLRGHVQVVLGTRAAVYAPVRNLGLIAVWADADHSHAERRAPYPHVREVAAMRSDLEGAGLLVGGWSASAQTAAWVEAGWAHPIAADRTVRRTAWADLRTSEGAGYQADQASSRARMPPAAYQALAQGLTRGPVLVQVPRTGYIPALTCQSCRRPARCASCAGPVALTQGEAGHPACRWCGREAMPWRCDCGSTALRASAVGEERTAEELGRSFAGARVVRARAEQGALTAGPGTLVVATPGIEPVVPGGYAAAVLLDGDRLLDYPDLDSAEQALLRWLQAAALVRSRAAGGVVVLCADPGAAPVQAFVRADPGWFAQRELGERASVHLPPACALIIVDGPWTGLESIAATVKAAAADVPGLEVLGPVPVPGSEEPEPDLQDALIAVVKPSVRAARLVIRAPASARKTLTRAVTDAVATRSARREAGTVRVQVDPPDPLQGI